MIDSIILDKSRERGRIWFAILWQTGARTEHVVTRNTARYDDHAHIGRIEELVRTLNAQGMIDREVAGALAAEGILNNDGRPFTEATIHQLRQRWRVPSVRLNGAGACPAQWPDGSYSARGAADAIGITVQTVFQWIKRGRLNGRRPHPHMPWQIDLTNDQITALKDQPRPVGQSKRKAS